MCQTCQTRTGPLGSVREVEELPLEELSLEEAHKQQHRKTNAAKATRAISVGHNQAL